MYDNLLGKRNCITWFYEAPCPLTPDRVIVVLAPIGFDQISVGQTEKGPGPSALHAIVLINQISLYGAEYTSVCTPFIYTVYPFSS